MPIIVGKYSITAGDVYAPGSVIDHLEPEEEKRLVESGAAYFQETEELQEAEGQQRDDLSVEEFAKLKADEQKEELQKLGIEPESAAPARLEQYKQYLDAKAAE